jgi:hypothetical protein
MCNAVCAHCKRNFPYPSLGDFAYGSFILNREDGRAFRYLWAIDNSVWNFVAARVQEIVRPGPGAAVLQEVVARLADRSEGRSFTMENVCPYCKSRHFRDWGREQVSQAEIADATFHSFTALDEKGKERLVKELERLVNAEQAA